MNNTTIATLLIKILVAPAAVLGIYIISKICYALWYNNRKKTYNIPVQATCVRLLERHSDNGSTYAPEFEFNYLGTTRRISQRFFEDPTPYETGQTYALLINAEANRYILAEASRKTVGAIRKVKQKRARIILVIFFSAVWYAVNENTFRELFELIFKK